MNTGMFLLFRQLSSLFLSLILLFWLFFPGSLGLAHFSRWFSISFLGVAILVGSIFLLLFGIYSRNIKFVLRGFRLNKIYFILIAFYLIRDLVAIVGNYSYLMQNDTVFFYTVSCLFRLVLFCGLIYFINLLYMDFYDKKCSLKILIWGVVFVAISFLIFRFLMPVKVQKYDFWYSISYIIQTKPPMILFLLMILHFFFKKINFKYFFIAILGVFLCSFQGKRSGIFLGCVSLLLFMWMYFIKLSTKKKWFCKGCVALLLTLLAFKILGWRNYQSSLYSDRVLLFCKCFPNFTNSDTFNKFLGYGDLLEKVGYPHNVLLSLLLSTGIIGAVLWLCPFVYILICFWKFKEKSFIDLCLWVPLIMYFLNSFTTGFYLYHTPLYFLLYFMEYRYRYLEKRLALY